MNSRYAWYSFCLLFLIYNIAQLLTDSKRITFYVVEKDDVLFDQITNFSVCTSFSEIKRNSKQLASKLEKVNVKSFISHSIASIENSLNSKFKLFDLERSYLFNGHTCFLVEKRELENKLAEFIRAYEVALFIFSYSKNPFFYEYIHLKRSNRYDSILLRTHKRKI